MSSSLSDYDKLKKERDDLAKELDNYKEHLRNIKCQVSSFHSKISTIKLPKWLMYGAENIKDVVMSYYTGRPGSSHGFTFPPYPPHLTDFSEAEQADGTAAKAIRDYTYRWVNYGFE